MSRNLVVCMDGTNNKFGHENTNVVRLYQSLVDDPQTQRRYYDPGVGTMGHPGAISWIAQKVTALMGLGFGLGVTQNVLDANAFLMLEYQDGDRIFIFGFSRGALEARALAALLHRCGLLRPELETLAPYAVMVAQSVSDDEAKQKQHDEVAAAFKQTFSRSVMIHFLGLWDTVTAMGNIWSPINWPYTTNNSSVTNVRHAIALDERRTFFRQNRWAPDKKARPASQSVRELWFAGVHCDVGGGYAPNESALWTRPLEWMVDEACDCGLMLDRAMLAGPINAARAACNDSTGTRSMLHDSMKGLWPLWLIAEWVPKPRKVEKENQTESGDGKKKSRHVTEILWPVWHWFVPWLLNQGRMGRALCIGRARKLKPGELLHRSVLERFAFDPGYRPEPLNKIGLTEKQAKAFLVGTDKSYVMPDQTS